MLSSGEVWLGDMTIIDTEYMTVNTWWEEKEQLWKTLVQVSAEVLIEFKDHRTLPRVLDSGRVGTVEESKRLHEYAIDEVYKGAYRRRVQDLLRALEPVEVEVQEDDN